MSNCIFFPRQFLWSLHFCRAVVFIWYCLTKLIMGKIKSTKKGKEKRRSIHSQQVRFACWWSVIYYFIDILVHYFERFAWSEKLKIQPITINNHLLLLLSWKRHSFFRKCKLKLIPCAPFLKNSRTISVLYFLGWHNLQFWTALTQKFGLSQKKEDAWTTA